jgi:hypothetical protein
MEDYKTQPKAGGAYEIPEGSKYHEPTWPGVILVTGTIRDGYFPIRVMYRADDGGIDESIADMSDADLREIVKAHKEKHGDCFDVRFHKQSISDRSYSGFTVYSGTPIEKHVVFTSGYSPYETEAEKAALAR